MRAAKRHLIFFYLSFLCQAISNTLGISGFAPASPRITSPAREGGKLWFQKNGVLSEKTTSFSQVSNCYLPLAAMKFNPSYSNSLIQYRISTFLNECNTHLARFPAYYISAPVGGRLWDHDNRRFFMQERENVVFLCGPRDHGQMSVYQEEVQQTAPSDIILSLVAPGQPTWRGALFYPFLLIPFPYPFGRRLLQA